MEIATWKIRPMPWKKSRSIPSQMRGSHGKKEHGQTSSVQIKISGGLGLTRETREKWPPSDFLNKGLWELKEYMKGVLPWLVFLLCLYKICLIFLRCSCRPSTKYFFTISLHLSSSPSKLDKQVVTRRLSLNKCLWMWAVKQISHDSCLWSLHTKAGQEIMVTLQCVPRPAIIYVYIVEQLCSTICQCCLSLNSTYLKRQCRAHFE
jgi:hypothetical protein